MKNARNNNTSSSLYFTDARGIVHLNFGVAAKHYDVRDEASLRFVIKDCEEAIAANPESPKAGAYADTIHVCVAQLAKLGL